MKSDPPILRLLVINLCLIFSLTTGEIEFYQDVEQEPSDTDVRLKQLERYLESQNRPRFYRRDHAPPHHHPQPYDDDYSMIYRQRQNPILDALIENPRILDILEKTKPSYVNHQSDYGSINYPRSLPLEDVDPPIYKIPKFKLPHPDHRLPENFYFENSPNYRRIKQPIGESYEDMETSLEQLREKLLAINEEKHEKHERMREELPEKSEKFTYHFNEPTFEESRDEFAAKPNDPRFYERDQLEHVTRREEQHPEDEGRGGDFEGHEGRGGDFEGHEGRGGDFEGHEGRRGDFEGGRGDFEGHEGRGGDFEGEERRERGEDDGKHLMQIPISMYEDRARGGGGDEGGGGGGHSKMRDLQEMMPEPQRRAEKDPVITVTSTKENNDVYFIAIVAGCSAAAMFGLVLISLTWCRLQRGVKAAADIEYPAYGVTGPNKDVSPSGDQRLAHSAQMYHFQHQKQQIIAMEKSSSSRDPGSVSEAESDEENEEGDYTVYECPGLAPAGEVEVKNPMFHDDPTPATPQNHRDEDHRH